MSKVMDRVHPYSFPLPAIAVLWKETESDGRDTKMLLRSSSGVYVRVNDRIAQARSSDRQSKHSLQAARMSKLSYATGGDHLLAIEACHACFRNLRLSVSAVKGKEAFLRKGLRHCV